ncbi:unnamed protein product, partial [Linum tenue]
FGVTKSLSVPTDWTAKVNPGEEEQIAAGATRTPRIQKTTVSPLHSHSFFSAGCRLLPPFLSDQTKAATMFDDQDLGFFANFLGIFIFLLVIVYHYVVADPKYE